MVALRFQILWRFGKAVPRLCAAALLSMVGYSGLTHAGNQDARTAMLSPQISFYERPAADVVSRSEAITAWAHLAPQVMAELGERTISGVLFAHYYSAGKRDDSAAEWILTALTREGNDQVAVLMRFGLQSHALLARHRVSIGQTAAIDLDRATAVFDSHPMYPDRMGGQGALEEVDGFLFKLVRPTDFGGTQVLTRRGGKLIFSATTIHDGTGRLLYPAGALKPE